MAASHHLLGAESLNHPSPMSRTWEEKQAVLRVISFKALTSTKLWHAASDSAGWWKSHQHQSHSQNVSYPLGSAQCPAGERNETNCGETLELSPSQVPRFQVCSSLFCRRTSSLSTTGSTSTASISGVGFSARSTPARSWSP